MKKKIKKAVKHTCDCFKKVNFVKEWCEEKYIGYTCTRLKGHKGLHVACGMKEHNISSWK